MFFSAFLWLCSCEVNGKNQLLYILDELNLSLNLGVTSALMNIVKFVQQIKSLGNERKKVK